MRSHSRSRFATIGLPLRGGLSELIVKIDSQAILFGLKLAAEVFKRSALVTLESYGLFMLANLVFGFRLVQCLIGAFNVGV